MNILITLISIIILNLVNPTLIEAQVRQKESSTGLEEKAKRGWWFYEDPERKKEEAKKKQEPTFKPNDDGKKPEKESKKEDPCKKAETWNPKCGFVDPGMDYDFQAKQRDELLNRMSLSKNDPAAVEAFQYYMKWATERSLEVANIWMYNIAQNPDLDSTVNAPVSNFGLRLMRDVQKGQDKEIFKAIDKEHGGALVYFTRTDCSYCHSMMHTVKKMSKKMGTYLWNVSLDKECLPGFDECATIEKGENAARALKVATVPSLFLYVKPDTWIRVSTGMATESEIEGRVLNFFLAYRHALAKGISNSPDGRPSVDFGFQKERPFGTAKGVESTGNIKKPNINEFLQKNLKN